MYISLALLAAAVSALFLVPLPSRVWAPFELQPHDAASVYVEVPGQLVKVHVKPGQRVEEGDPLVDLENLDLELEVAQLRGQRDSLAVRRDGLENLRFTTDKPEEVSLEAKSVAKQLSAVENQLKQKSNDLKRLHIVAPTAGTVIPPPRVEEPPGDKEVELPSWTGTPLDRTNLGASLSPDGPQNLLCQIGDPNEWDAVLVIDQDDVDLVQEGQEVKLMFEESAYHVFVSTIANRADDAMSSAPPRLASTNGGPLAAQPERDGTLRPLSTSYQAVARLDNSSGLLRNGLIGRARITTRPRPIAERVWRYLSRTFNFEL
jgi:putative peptide zinc metalloprotease protein